MSPLRLSRQLLIATLCAMLGVCVARPVQAQTSPDKLLKLLKRRPANMARDSWRAQRREAARELGRLRDRRAVGILLSIIAKERFDVILEIAIDALGNIGDKRAVDPLKRLLNDPSLDAYVRDAVAGALKKLGSASPTPARRPTRRSRRPGKPPGDNTTQPTPVARGFAKLRPLSIAEPPDDLLGRSGMLDITLGDARFDWQGHAETTRIDLAVGARYLSREERKKVGMSLDLAGSVGFDMLDPAGDDDGSWALQHPLQATPEIRFYPFQKDLPLLFGQLSGGLGYGMRVNSGPNALESTFSFSSTITAALAPGYGRILDQGSQLRLKRIVWILRKAGLLEKVVNVDSTTANQIAGMWFAYQNKLGSYSRLGYTLRLLRKAGLLKEDPDPATVYRLIRVLDDPQLFNRREGYSCRVGYGYARTLVLDNADRDLGYLFSTASYHRQIGTTREAGGEARFYWSHIGEPDTYAFTLDAYYNKYRYNRAFDPLGSMGFTLSTGFSKQASPSFANSGLSYKLLGGISYSRFFNQGSRIIVAANGGVDNRGGLLLLTISAHLGVTQASMATIQ